MTIKERIDEAKHYPHDGYQGEPARYSFSKDKLYELLKQVAKEQREIIAKELPDRCFVDIDESWITSMGSPLNEDSHE